MRARLGRGTNMRLLYMSRCRPCPNPAASSTPITWKVELPARTLCPMGSSPGSNRTSATRLLITATLRASLMSIGLRKRPRVMTLLSVSMISG